MAVMVYAWWELLNLDFIKSDVPVIMPTAVVKQAKATKILKKQIGRAAKGLGTYAR